MKSLCRALLVLNVLYCALAVAQEGLPGWHMFELVERLDHTLTDREGARVDIRAYLPRNAWLVDHGELEAIARFICDKERSRAPFTLDEPSRGTRIVLGPEDCRAPAAARGRGAAHAPR